MPDTKFSFAALREHLRKYLWIYLIGIAICLLGTSLLWPTTESRPPNEQTVTIYLADVGSNPEPLEPFARDALAAVQAEFPDIRQVEFQSLNYMEQDYTSSMVLLTRLAVGECDAFLCSQAVMDALVQSEALLDLEPYVKAGWMADCGLEPYEAEFSDDETGEHYRLTAGLRLDSVAALYDLRAFYNEGAYLCVTGNGGNVDSTLRALEIIMKALTEGDYAQPENPEPTA